VASDLTPELLEAGRRLAAERGAELEWHQADAEALPYADDEFDTVLSCVGVMFAPHHQVTADELVRVVRPGGTIGLINWTPEGFIGQLFATMKPYAPPPPPGAQPPPLWGDEEHVRGLLGDRLSDVTGRKQTVRIDHFDVPEDFREYFKTNYGPTIAVYKSIADDPDRVAALDHELAELARRFDVGTGTTTLDWEYLLLTARKR
jgi:SAM-dependent methyltransferase